MPGGLLLAVVWGWRVFAQGIIRDMYEAEQDARWSMCEDVRTVEFGLVQDEQRRRSLRHGLDI